MIDLIKNWNKGAKKIFGQDKANLEQESSFYYDETNNIRKFTLDNWGKNDISKDFILAGLVFDKNYDTSNTIHNIINNIKISPNQTEIKFNSICGRKDFLECLKSKNLSIILGHLRRDENIFIHLTSVNLLYLIAIDIILSVCANHIENEVVLKFYHYYRHECNTYLYEALKFSLDDTKEIFHLYSYPNIQDHKIEAFTASIIDLIDAYQTDHTESYIYLHRLKRDLEDSNNLIFIQNNPDNILINDFTGVYLHQLTLFYNSHHYFDEEDHIAKILKNSDNAMNNYSFLDSKKSTLIQLSDVIVGLLNKLYIYSKRKDDFIVIYKELRSLNDLQKENLLHLYHLFNDSAYSMYINRITSLLSTEKINFILEYARLNPLKKEKK